MATINVKFENQLITDAGTIVNIITTKDNATRFVQNESCTAAGVAIHNYGTAMIPAEALFSSFILEAVKNNIHYYLTSETIGDAEVGQILTMDDQGGGK